MRSLHKGPQLCGELRTVMHRARELWCLVLVGFDFFFKVLWPASFHEFIQVTPKNQYI